MVSSMGSAHTDSDGADNGARTPTHHAHAAAASELSPPGSQTQQIPPLQTIKDFKGTEGDTTQAAAGQGAEQPIAAWKSKRAQDDYQRAMEHVIDRDFNLRMCCDHVKCVGRAAWLTAVFFSCVDEFGDPFDERDLEEKLP